MTKTQKHLMVALFCVAGLSACGGEARENQKAAVAGGAPGISGAPGASSVGVAGGVGGAGAAGASSLSQGGAYRCCGRPKQQCWGYCGCRYLCMRRVDLHGKPNLRHTILRWRTCRVHGRDGRRLSDGLAQRCLPRRPIRESSRVCSRSVHASSSRLRGRARGLLEYSELLLHQPKLGLSVWVSIGHRAPGHLRWGRMKISRVFFGHRPVLRSWAFISCGVVAWGCGGATVKQAPASGSTSRACAVPAFPPAATCAETCGNGVRDSCPYCAAEILTSGGAGGPGGSAGPACPEGTTAETLTETCDGSDLGSSTCTSLGFTGGTIACTSLCSYDTNGCDSCLPDAHSLACRHTELVANSPSSLALTASVDQIAVAWVAGPGLLGNDPVAGSARLAVFAPDLSLISQTGCFGPANAHRVALARSRSGYVTAVDDDGDTGVTIQLFDATGAAVGAPRILAGASYPALIERIAGDEVSGGPLLVWSEAPAGGPNAAMASRCEPSCSETMAPPRRRRAPWFQSPRWVTPTESLRVRDFSWGPRPEGHASSRSTAALRRRQFQRRQESIPASRGPEVTARSSFWVQIGSASMLRASPSARRSRCRSRSSSRARSRRKAATRSSCSEPGLMSSTWIASSALASSRSTARPSPLHFVSSPTPKAWPSHGSRAAAPKPCSHGSEASVATPGGSG